MAQPILDGIRIIDMTSGLAGPVATHLLAEVGADVIKIEPPTGDPVRGTAAFATWNRSKRGVVVDLNDDSDHGRLDDLLATADVLVHGLRPSKAAAHGLDDATLASKFPQLIVSSVLGYPIDHPDAERPGYDILVQARTGAMDEMTAHRGGPMFLRFPLPSWATVYLTIAGILSRLIVRDRTGKAGPAHTSLYQGMMAVLAMLWNRGDHTTEMMRAKVPLSKAAPGPALVMFQCADGQWIQLVLGFADNPLVIETLAEMGEFIEFDAPSPPSEVLPTYERMFKRRTSEEWLAAFRNGDVPSEPVQPLGSVFRDPQVIANEYVVDVDDPVWGRARQTLAPFRADPPSAVSSPAPTLDQHRDEVFADGRRKHAPPGTCPYPARRLLEGVKVLDLGMFLAGPFAPMLLADLGADVIKVEPPTGDRMRTPHQMTLFVGCQRGKRSVVLDLQHPDSRPVLERLIQWADIVHHNLRLPAARRIGVDYESLKAINPAIVYCHVSSYGHSGEKADWPGYDPIGQAASGWPVESGPPDKKPVWHRFGMMDHQCAMSSLVPTLLALYKRDRTGEGSYVSGSLLSAAAETNSETMLLLDFDTLAPYVKVDDEQTGLAPGYRIYHVADDQWVAVAALDHECMAAFRRVARVDDDGVLAAALADRDAFTLLAELEAAGVPSELVRRDWEHAFFDSEVGQPSRQAVAYPHSVWGRFEQPGAFWNLGDLELFLELPPPLLGQHTQEILTELGFDDASVTKLGDAGVVASPNVASA